MVGQTQENIACPTSTCDLQKCTSTQYKNTHGCSGCNDNCFKKQRSTTLNRFTNVISNDKYCSK